MPINLPFHKLDAIVVPGGRVGMVTDVERGYVWVRFDEDGPKGRYVPSALRWATAEDVRLAGAHALPMTVLSEQQKARRTRP